MRAWQLILFWSVSFAAGAGCGDPADEIPTVPVEGKVLLGNKPLTTGGLVIFYPDTGNKYPYEARGQINEQGVYKLFCYAKQKDGNAKQIDGAPIGAYRVAVIATKEPKDTYGDPISLINPKFGDPNESKLTVQVVENPAAGAYDLKVSR